MRYDNWEQAYAQARPGDTLILTEGMPPERLEVGKRLIVRSHNGFELSDEGLDYSPEQYVVQVVSGGEGTDLRLVVRVTTMTITETIKVKEGTREVTKQVTRVVPRSAGGIFLQVDSDVLAGSRIYGPGKEYAFPSKDVPAPLPIGIRVNRGTGSKTMRVLGAAGDPVRVTDFGTGIFIDNPSFHVTSYVRAEWNQIGLLQRWGRGQNFYGIWKHNDVAIEMQAVHHNDTNGHNFECNGIALKSAQTDEPNPITHMKVNGPHLEYNFHVVTTCGGIDVLVQDAQGQWVEDRTKDPGAYIQYSQRRVNGILIPTWKTGEPD